jgi:predicted nucleic acid-binding protein
VLFQISRNAGAFNSIVTSLPQVPRGAHSSVHHRLIQQRQVDYVLLDDSTARREARRLGLTIKGTLAVIKKLSKDGTISIESLDNLYQQLMEIEFRVKRSLFDQIFSED